MLIVEQNNFLFFNFTINILNVQEFISIIGATVALKY